MPLFPSEIAGQSVEELFVERHSGTQVIYMLVILMIVGGLAVLRYQEVRSSG
jgi:hypothetical protein